MKKVININFQGRVIPIEESAYDILKQYVESLRRYFASEEGRDEIINDIEGRIAELFGETLKKGNTCITDDDVNAIIASIGRPEDFEGEEDHVKSQLGGDANAQQQFAGSQFSSATSNKLYRNENGKVIAGVCKGIADYFNVDPIIIRILFVIFAFGFGFGFITYLVLWVAVPSTASKVIGSSKKRLLRDPDDKILGGVCRGLSYYFGINVWIPRLLFLVPFFSFIFRWSHWGMFDFPHFLSLSFSPGATLIYIILWLVLPEAKTASDKLEMKGEKVDINSIKNTISEEIKSFQDRIPKIAEDVKENAPKMAQEFSDFTREKAKSFSAEVSGVARKTGSSLGDIIALIAKIFAYFILAVVLFSVVASLFGIGVVFTGLLPLKSYLITDGAENMYVWGTLILFIWVPVIGIITWIIRRVAKMRSNSHAIRYGFLALWLLGLFCFIGLIVSLKNDFKYHNYPAEQNVVLSNPAINKLELRALPSTKYYGAGRWLHFEPFADIDEDTVNFNNVEVRIVKSATDSFQVSLLKLTNGNSKQQAEQLASKINYKIVQRDSTLLLDKGISITPAEKFRNQRVYITVAVPVGKRIKIADNINGWENNVHVDFGWDMNEWEWKRDNGSETYDLSRNVEYIMTKNGPERVDGKKNNDDHKDENDEDNSRTLDEFKKNKEQLEKEREQKLKDLQKIDEELKKPADSTRYQYKPQPAKPAEPKKVTASLLKKVTDNRPINMTSLLLGKLIL